MKLTGRKSTNVETAEEHYAERNSNKAMASKVLRDPKPLASQPLEKNTRVGVLEPTMDDAPFFKHTEKDCM